MQEQKRAMQSLLARPSAGSAHWASWRTPLGPLCHPPLVLLGVWCGDLVRENPISDKHVMSVIVFPGERRTGSYGRAVMAAW